MSLAFISYRRDDTRDAAQAIYAQLKVHFGSGQLFMDVNSIAAGQEWPTRIRDQVERATGMLVLIGTHWFHAHDTWGRRRIDSPTDWVALEIETALQRRIPVIPVLVGRETAPPDEGSFPNSLRGIAITQRLVVDNNTWPEDIDRLVRVCRSQFGLTERAELQQVIRPDGDSRKRGEPPTETQELAEFLRGSSGWEAWEDSLPREYPSTRQELRKNFTFPTFRLAAEFMRQAGELFEGQKHHPRWSNEWGLVVIALSTWDAGNIITSIDLQVARLLDELYTKFKAQHPETWG